MTDSISIPKGERTRLAIIDAAHQLFVDQGYAATSMRQISERSGLALGGIYNHFPNKEAIFVAVILSKHPFFQILPLLKATSGDTIEEFVRSAAKSMVSELGRRPDFVRLLFVELVEFEGENVPKIFDTIYPDVLPLVQRFINGKSELRDISPLVLFRAFLGLFFSYYMTEMVFAKTPMILMQKDSLDTFVDIFLHGVLAPKEPL